MELKELKDNPFKLAALLFCACLILSVVPLYQAINGYGALYPYLAPEIYTENYILESQYIGSIDDDGKHYENVLILEVVEYDIENDVFGENERLYFADDNNLLDGYNEGDIISVTWVKQKLDEPYIHGVTKYNENIESVNVSMFDF